MEPNIHEKASELARMLADSTEYRKYLESREALKQDEELYKKVNEYRKDNFLLQIQGEEGNLYEETGMLQENFASVRKDSRVDHFLKDELSLCKLVQQIYTMLLDELDFDVDFLG